MKFVKKKGPAPFNTFTTSKTGIPRNASLTYAPPSETPPGTIQPDTMSVRLYDYNDIEQTLTPISPAVSYGEITGFESIPIPPNAATDPGAWWSQFPKLDRISNDSCSSLPSELNQAWTNRNTKFGAPGFQNIAKRMVRCESLRPPWGAFNIPPIEEKEAIQEDAKKKATQVDAFANNQYTKWLKTQASKAGITGAPLFAFLAGPAAFLSYAKQVNAVPQDATAVPIGALALAVADSLLILSKMDKSGTQNAVYELTRVHGEDYGAQLDQMLSIFDATLAQSKKDAFAKKKAGIPMGGLLMTPGTIAAPGMKAADAYSQRQGRKDNKRRGDAASEEAAIEFDQFYNAALAQNAKAITATIAEYRTCTTPGKVIQRKLHADQFKRDRTYVTCGSDPSAWDVPNGPTLGNALRSELDAQQGIPAKAPAPPGAQGTILPFAIAGIGFVTAGPIGAAAGFALGKQLEKK